MTSSYRTPREGFYRIITTLVVATSLGAISYPAVSADPHPRPNIIFIMSDDHAAHGISAHGSTISRTPNIDRLAEEGMRFTNMFGVNSLCAPSRAILITGKHSHVNGMFNKMWMYEPSQRTPLLVRWPGVVKPKSVNEDLVCNLDFMPTFLETAGAEIPDDLHGRSIVPLLKATVPDDWRKAVYYHYHGGYEVPPHLGVRTKTHKLIHFPGEQTAAGAYWELFDLRQDPNEMRNVYGQAEYRAVQAALHDEFRTLAIETGDEVGMRAAKEVGHP